LQGNNVQDAACSTIHGFLGRYTCVSSTQLNISFGTSRDYFQFENPKLQEVFLSKTDSFSQRNNVLDAPDCNTLGFLSRNTCIISTKLSRPIRNNNAYLHLEKP
jgi:hypothetical protein